MTLEEFYVELNKTKPMVNWTMRQPDGAIRGFTEGKEPKMLCPLTAVVYYSKNFYLETWKGFSATAELNMNPNDASAILLAADNCPAYADIRRILEQILFGPDSAS